MYLRTFRVLYKLYLSTDVLKYKVLLPGFAEHVKLVAESSTSKLVAIFRTSENTLSLLALPAGTSSSVVISRERWWNRGSPASINFPHLPLEGCRANETRSKWTRSIFSVPVRRVPNGRVPMRRVPNRCVYYTRLHSQVRYVHLMINLTFG